MGRVQAEPTAMLRPFVDSYWSIVREVAPGTTFTITPDRFLEVLFFVESPKVDVGTEVRSLPACTLIPLLDAPIDLELNGVVRCAAIRLNAWAAGMLFPSIDCSLRTWCDATAIFADIVPTVAAALRADDWPQITAVLDRKMTEILADASVFEPSLSVVRAFLVAPHDGVRPSTAHIATEHALSRRQIERNVRALTLRAPKELSSLARFQYVRDTLWAKPQSDLRDLALAAGYTDQAHLTRQFRRFAAQSPRQFARASELLKTLLPPDNDVAFVQDIEASRTVR